MDNWVTSQCHAMPYQMGSHHNICDTISYIYKQAFTKAGSTSDTTRRLNLQLDIHIYIKIDLERKAIMKRCISNAPT